MATMNHPQLGPITGKETGDVTEYLGLKYGTIDHRFAEPAVFSGRPVTGDATCYGPSVVGPDACDFELGLIQHELPHGAFPQSDLDGLNLNITVPRLYKDKKLLPVMVFIHGGGFAIGSSAWPQANLTKFVQQSIHLGQPVIGVTINYRLGALGFLTSEELRQAGFKTNNGLRDQKVALLWLKQYIGGFNGNAEDITVVGQSAGAASANLLLASGEPLFKRVACLGGQSQAVKIQPLSAFEKIYQAAILEMGLESLEPAERIHQLKTMPSEKLVLPPFIPNTPVVDGDLVKEVPTFAQLKQGLSSEKHGGWCEELFIGDCQMDGSIFTLALGSRSTGIGAAFAQSLSRSLEDIPGASEAVLRSYGIASHVDDSEALNSILNFGNDLVFYAPAIRLAEAWSGPVYFYHFNEPNPWEGPWKGQTSHILDVAFLWHNFDDYLNEEQKRLGSKFGADLIQFINGSAPFPALAKGRGAVAQVYGPSSKLQSRVVQMYSTETGRRTVIWELMEKIGGDRLNDAFWAFVAGK